MKRYLSILFAFTLNFSIAQGNNLQFNQVITNQYSKFCNSPFFKYSVDTIIVPQNKVWKITHSSVYNDDEDGYSASIFIDNIKVRSDRTAIGTGNPPSDNILWLKSGSYTVYLMSLTVGGNHNINGSISGIEFNIVQ